MVRLKRKITKVAESLVAGLHELLLPYRPSIRFDAAFVLLLVKTSVPCELNAALAGASAGLAAMSALMRGWVPGWVILGYVLNYGLSIGVIAINHTGQSINVVAVLMLMYLCLSFGISALGNAYNRSLVRRGGQ